MESMKLILNVTSEVRRVFMTKLGILPPLNNSLYWVDFKEKNELLPSVGGVHSGGSKNFPPRQHPGIGDMDQQRVSGYRLLSWKTNIQKKTYIRMEISGNRISHQDIPC